MSQENVDVGSGRASSGGMPVRGFEGALRYCHPPGRSEGSSHRLIMELTRGA